MRSKLFYISLFFLYFKFVCSKKFDHNITSNTIEKLPVKEESNSVTNKNNKITSSTSNNSFFHEKKNNFEKYYELLKKFGINFKNDILKITHIIINKDELFKNKGLKSFAYNDNSKGDEKKKELFNKYKTFRSKNVNNILKHRKHFLVWG
jgi:hypothetical protein